MTPLGNSIVVNPKPREKVLKSGIILPDTATPGSQEWGTCLESNAVVTKGAYVLYLQKRGYSKEEEKVIQVNKVLYWV